MRIILIFFIGSFIFLISCKKEVKDSSVSKVEYQNKTSLKAKAPQGMIFIQSKIFLQGAKSSDKFAMSREKPAHKVTVDDFYIDETEVTNSQFQKFVDATKYITVAERKVNWEELKKQVPSGTPKPHDSILQPGSLIFNKNVNAVVNMQNYAQWWTWKLGANWKHPEGSNSSIEGKDNFPVVHITIEDALAYCKWANRRLPTEAEWEAAAQGNNTDAIFTWGNDSSMLQENANTWQGIFPSKNESKDGFEFISPVKSYPPNSLGLYDMTGNVWEITSDLFDVNYYKELNITNVIENPTGAIKSYNPNNPFETEYVMKGGSFLCHASYCASYRISAKMDVAVGSSSDHVGFRTVVTPNMLNK